MSYFEEFSKPMEIHVLTHNGFKYVKASDVRTRLNEVVDCKWSFEVLKSYPSMDAGVGDDVRTILVLGRLYVDIDGVSVSKDAFGSCDIRRFTKGPNKGNIIDLGMDFQTAAVAAFKACAKMLGVADNIEEGEEAVVSQAKAPISKPASKPAVQPSAEPQRTSSTGMSEDVAKKLQALKEKAAKASEKSNAENVSKPIHENKASEQPAQEQQNVDGFDYSKNIPNSIAVKKMILANLADNMGTTSENLIKSAYGDEITLDNITESQLTSIIGGQFESAASNKG